MARQASPGKQQLQQQQTRYQQVVAGNDDELPAAPPAFPQPLTGQLRNQAAQFIPTSPQVAAQAAAVQQQQYASTVLPVSSRAYCQTSRAYSQTIPAQLQVPQQGDHMLLGTTAAGFPYCGGSSLFAPAGNTAVGYSSAPRVFPTGSFTIQHGYGVDELPALCDPVMGQYPGPMYNTVYAGDAGVPLLSAGYTEDMVFANRQMRHAFLRKVLGLMTVQLLLTAIIAAPIHMSTAARHFLHDNPWVCGLAVILTFTVLLIMAWSESARRQHPTNQILLAIFTAANGLLVGTASATYSTPVLLLGLLIAATVSLALIVYAAQTSADFTASGGMLYSAVIVLLVVSLADWFLGFQTLHLLIAGCGALVFSAYLVYDIQLLASGESWYQVSADEYVFATINVYTDVITLFMYILQVLTQLQGGDGDY